MTIAMETGLIYPPVGLDIVVIKNIAPDIALADIIRGVLPFVVLTLLAVVPICMFPGESLPPCPTWRGVGAGLTPIWCLLVTK
jgi:C4-dicarboxylate transporter DctM subunit